MGINDDNWKEFFLDSNEGLGTLYDRVLLETYFQKLILQHGIKSVLDCPSFGLHGFSGIGSICLARKGIPVTVCDNNQERLEWIEKLWNTIGLNADFILVTDYSKLAFDDRSFDLVWNLAALWYIKNEDLTLVLKELSRVADKCLFMSVNNRRQLFYPVWKRLEPEFFNYVREEYSDEKFLDSIFSSVFHEFDLSEKGYLITTPWPGLIMKKGGIFRRGKPSDTNLQTFGSNNIEVPEYVDHLMNETSRTKLVNRLLIFEKLPNLLKKYWAHLSYWVFAR
jgi:hypothetical protein